MADELQTLIQQQFAVQQSLNQLISNTKKDSSSRKTKEYLQKRLADLEKQWKEFKERHEQILTFEVADEQYIEENVYKATRDIVEAGRKLIKETYKMLYPVGTNGNEESIEKVSEKNTEPKIPSPADNTNEDPSKPTPGSSGQSGDLSNPTPGSSGVQSTNNLKFESIHLKRLHLRLQRLQRSTYKAMEYMKEGGSKFQYEQSVQELSKQINSLEVLLEETLMVDAENNQINEIMDLFEEIVERGNDTISRLRQAIESIGEQNLKKRPPKLAPVTIPKFDGKFKQWIAFKNLFINVIHENDCLSEVEKLRYLQTNLEGEPSKMISHLPLTSKNYNVAWQIIMQRYENPRKIITTYFDTLLELPTCSAKTGVKLLHDTMKECIEGLKVINMITDESPIITHIGIKKLDTENLKAFEESLCDQKQLPTIHQLLKFLEARQLLLETINNKRNPNQGVNVGQMSSERERCILCQGDHKLYKCPGFEKMRVWERNKFVNKKRICKNCLSHNARTKCISKFVCTECHSRHHTLLHYQKNKLPSQQNKQASGSTLLNSSNKTDPQPSGSNTTTVATNQTFHHTPVLLSTALIYIKARCGRFEPFRALIDQGSQASLITENAAHRLGLPRMASEVEVTGLGANKPKHSKHKILIEIRPHFSNKSELQVVTHILPRLTGELPNENINDGKNRWDNIILADPNYDTPGPIDVILGADVYSSIVLKGIKAGNPMASKTKLGWILNGPTTAVLTSNVLLSHVSLADVHESMTRFWDIEEVTQTQNFTEDDEIYNKAKIKKLASGRYEVNLPFKRTSVQLGQSRKQAVARFLQVERTLESNPQKRYQYHNFMKEYLQLNHMVLENKCIQDEGCYLPHHGVWKNDSVTTKLRVVFDASARTSNGRSLNDEMLIGPTLQEKMTSILTRWRMHKYVFTADIEKMYRQIHVTEHDQKYQKILWRFNSKDPIQDFKLTTVTYGTAAAPYLAIRTLQKLADEETNNIQIRNVIKQDFYVDDLMSGAETIKEASSIIKEINTTLEKGGFILRKWMSNNLSIIEKIPGDRKLNSMLELNKESSVKTLGVWWNPSSDQFSFKINIKKPEKRTKRTFLSNMSKIFDPMGWLAPITVTAKIMIQDLWSAELGWDEKLPDSFQNRWEKLEKELLGLENLRIPRYIQTHENNRMEIHGFCDASEKAYAAAVYVRVSSDTGWYVSLLGAKTKVAPLNKEQTIPRLELCGAVLLTNYIQDIMKAFHAKKNTPIYYWTDSSITLAWIKGKPERWKSFVAHRVSEILKFSTKDQWQHVSTNHNPADMASRGIKPAQIIDNKLWWTGPTWLCEQMEYQENETEFTTHEEEKCVKLVKAFSVQTKTEFSNLIERFSSLGRLVRVVSYIRRFKTKNSGNLTAKELAETTTIIIKLIQNIHFKEDITMIRANKGNKVQNKLLQLSPFIDSQSILRVGGRLANLQIQTIAKHPIILPTDNHFTKLIIDHAHKQTLHGGNQLTLAFIRQTYWIPNAKDLVRKNIHKCILCRRLQAQTANQIMGNLPIQRINPAPPFTNSGVDYAGPINIRVSKGRGNKSYKGFIAVFVCFVTKAIHLEAVSDLTTDAFLAAYKRFTARRGHCSNIYSDNGTTFVGADSKQKKELQLVLKEASDTIAKFALEAETSWHFIPPNAPHFGGIWEAGVKSMKYHLIRMIGHQTLTFEELTTVLYQIEAVLNSRPISPMSDDPTDFEALTPGHFLIGRPLIARPEPDISDNKITSRWASLTKMMQDFWKIWSTQYLSNLQQRTKWRNKENNLKLGDLVAIKEDNQPPLKWSLGRIIETHPGRDGMVRTVTLKLPGNNTLKRPIVKLVPLPVSKEDNVEVGKRNVKTPRQTLITKILTEKAPKFKGAPRSWMRGENVTDLQEKATNLKKVSSQKSAQSRKRPIIRPYSSVKVLLLSAILVCFCPVQMTAQEFNVQPITQAGLLFAHDHSTLIQQGTWTITFQTNININNDIENLKTIEDSFRKLCDHKIQIKNKNDTCSNDIRLIASEVRFILAQISQIPRHRNKRSSGILGFLRDLLFGKSDHDEIEDLKRAEELQSRKTSGIILSTIDAVSASETKIQQQLYQVNGKLAEAIIEINNARKWKDKINNEMLEYRTTAAFEHAKAIVNDIKNHYNQLRDNMVIHKKELEIHIQKIKAAIPPDTTTLDLSLPELDRLGLQQQYQQDGIIKIEMNIPIISMHTYETFKVISIPNLETNSIITVENEFIAVNYDLQSYFFPNTNEGYTIDNDRKLLRKTIFKNINSRDGSNNCIAASIFKKQSKDCQVSPLPDVYDIWTELHQHNSFIFSTSNPEDITLVCNLTRFEIKVKVGLLKAPPGCHIKTSNFNIITSTDAAHSRKNLYFQQQEFTVENSIITPENNIIEMLKFNSTNINRNFTEIQNQAKELPIQFIDDQHSIWIWILPFICGILSILLLAIIITYYWKKRQKNQNQEIPNQLANDNLESTV